MWHAQPVSSESSGRDPAVDAAVRLSGFDSLGLTAPGGDGRAPVVPRQWRAILEDAGIADACRELIDGCRTVRRICGVEDKRRGKQLPRALIALAAVVRRLDAALATVAWFEPPAQDPAHAAMNALSAAVNDAVDALRELLESGEPHLVDAAITSVDRQLATFEQALVRIPDLDGPPPWALLCELFDVESNVAPGPPDLNAQALVAVSPLTGRELEEVSRRVVGHLLPADPAWIPDSANAVAGLVACERPLIAHRCALATRDLLMCARAERLSETVQILIDRRRDGEREFASHREIVQLLSAMRDAEAAGDAEANALATARTYAATVEGPVRRAAYFMLRLLGAEPGPSPTLSTLKERLEAQGEAVVTTDLARSIEPDWRNAVDHREAYWDAGAGLLRLRTQLVNPGDVFVRQAMGMAAAAGVEAGIAIAMTGSAELLSAIDRIAPVHTDRILVEHRLGRQLALHGVRAPRLETSGERLFLGPVPRSDLPGIFGALVASTEDLRSRDAVQIAFEDAPTLVLSRHAIRRAEQLSPRNGAGRRTVSSDAMLPALAVACVALGEEPSRALDLAAEKAARFVDINPEQETSRRALARRMATAARRADRIVQEIRRAVDAKSPGTTELLRRLRALSAAADAYERRGDPVVERMLAALRELERAQTSLPGDALPWFEPNDEQVAGSLESGAS
jgi:hypothetical protein